MTHLTRRQLLGAGALGLASQWTSLARGKGEKKYRTALIGSGWWGMNVLTEAMAAGQSKVTGLCDVDLNVAEAAVDQVEEKSGDRPRIYQDFRELLEREKPEIVIVATPDHWHALTTIAALKAGAHVFVEKPTGHTVRESRAMLDAARQADRVVQVGLHRRIGPHHVSGMKRLREGIAGKIGMVRMFAHGPGDVETPTANSAPPRGMDWDLYCGPAPLRPFNRKIHPGGWRNFLDFANGTLGDWGVHWLDQLLWWSEEPYPRRIFSTAGRPIKGEPVLGEKGQTSDAPDSQVAVYEFERFTAVWEHRRFADNQAEKHRIGCYFYGTRGTFHMGWRDGWTFYPANTKKDAIVHEDARLQEPDGHSLTLLWADFLASIAKGRPPVAGIELAHRSSCLPLLGMLSWKLGRSIQWDGRTEEIVGDPQASQLLGRKYRDPWKYPTA